ncbi:MAG: hypothetical protein KAJ09_05005, partial [Deltaproteobacteria bacterium]|nr:hypothetical protein [Deltaproteobacteria bacterium]
EGAGAAPLAAGLKIRNRFRGKKVVIVLSGGNIDVATLRWVLTDEGDMTGNSPPETPQEDVNPRIRS